MKFTLASLALLAALAAAGPAGAAAPPRFGGETLHRLGPDARQLRFEGETSAKSWAIYVTAAEARTRARIHLSYSNAISVMPEVSTLAISVNDIAVAQTPIAAASDPGALDVELPRGLLTEGYNEVRIAVAQRHRVDCSLEATYELWTQIDPISSGLTFPGLADPGVVSLDDLAAISPDPSGATTIRVALPNADDSVEVGRALRAAEAVAIRAGVLRPNVEIVEAIDERPGLWVLAGSRSELRARGFAAFLGENDQGPPSPQLAGMDVPGRVVVVAAGRDDKETAEAIEAILPARRPDSRTATASAAHTLDAANGFPLHGAMRVSLRDLGVETEEFNGRLYRTAFDVAMPADFYPADYDKLTLSLSAGYSAGLLATSQILVRVNDKEAGSMPLRNPRGDLFRDRPVSVSLGALRPGVNHIVVEAQTPAPEDAACDVRQLMDSKKRFVFFDQSELVVPALARVARLPNLASTLDSGFPYDGALPAQIYLPKRDRPTIAAAATFLARVAAMAGKPVEASVTFDREKALAGSTLFIGALDDFPPALVGRMGLDYRALKEAWSRPNVGETTGLSNSQSPPAAQLNAAEVYDSWADGARKGPGDLSARLTMRALYDRYINVHRGDFALLRAPDRAIQAPERATLVLAQAHGPDGGSQTWTMLVAANAAVLARDMRNLVAPSNWNAIEGRAAAFSPRAGAETLALALDAYFIPTEALTPGNLRLVAAGLMSANLDYYLVAVALGASVLGALTYLAVRAHGNRA